MADARPRRDAGQATVELALCLPVVLVAVLAVLQVAVLVRDQLALELAAREGARAGAVAASPAPAATAAAHATISLTPLHVDVAVVGGRVTVTTRSHRPTELPLIGRLLDDVELRARATMALEPP